MQTNWKLRILNGMHIGAEVTLLPSMTLGSDEQSADIVLKDDFIAPLLVTFVVRDEQIYVQAEDDTPALIQGGKKIETDVAVPLQTPLKIGGLVVAVAAATDKWQSEIRDYQVKAGFSDFSQAERILDTTSAAATQRQVSEGGQRKNKALVCGCVLLVSIGLGVSWLSPWGTPDNQVMGNVDGADPDIASTQTVQRTEDDDAALHQLLSAPQYRNVSLQKTDAGYYQLSGYVESQSLQHKLQVTVAAMTQQVELAVYNQAQIQDSAELILTNLGLTQHSLSVGEQPGTLRISIDGQNLPDWQKARKVLMTDISGLNQVELRYPTLPSPLEVLQELTADLPIANKLVFQEGDDVIRIKANLTNRERQQLSLAIAPFAKRFGDKPVLRYQQTSRREQTTVADLGIAAVRYGNNPYITHQNGQRYLPGAKLPNGDSLQSLNNEEITIVSERQIVTLQLRPENLSPVGTVAQTNGNE